MELLFNKKSIVIKVLGVFNSTGYNTSEKSVREMLHESIESLASETCSGGFLARKPVEWSEEFVKIGAMILAQGLHIEPNVFAEFLLEKHTKYGIGPLQRWGQIICVIRLDSKLERIKNLSRTPRSPEGVDPIPRYIKEELLDMLGYCVLGFLLTKDRHPTHKYFDK
jgi:hypothetical protein